MTSRRAAYARLRRALLEAAAAVDELAAVQQDGEPANDAKPARKRVKVTELDQARAERALHRLGFRA